MKLEDIFAEWDKDSKLDRTALDNVSLGIPQLHAKYVRYLSHERLILRKYEAEMKTLKFDKYEFYTDGPSENTPKDWLELAPARGAIIKADAQRYIDADRDIINLSLKIGMQQEKIEALKSIVDIISRLGFQVRSAIDWMKFMNGS